MKKVLSLSVVLALIASMALTACTSTTSADKSTIPADEPTTDTASTDEPVAGDDEPILIGGSIMTLAYPWFLGAQEGMENWAKDHPEANVVFQFEDANMDDMTCITQLENMATAGCKGIVIFPPSASGTIPTMVDLNKNKGIYFVVGDYPQEPDSADDAVWSTFVGHDSTALGAAQGEIAVEYLKTLGKADPICLFISRPPSGDVAQARLKGFSDTILAEFPNATIIEEGDTGAGDKNSAQDLMDSVLQREKTIDVVGGHNDAEVLGAFNAAVGAGRTEIKFIGLAGDKEVLTYIQDGNDMWLGEVLQDPVVLGYTAMDALWQAMNGGTLPEQYDLPLPEKITPDTIDDTNWQTWTWLG